MQYFFVKSDVAIEFWSRWEKGLYLDWVCVGLADEWKDVERNEEPVEQVIRQHFVQVVDLQTEDVVQVVQMIQMLGNQVFQSTQTSMTGKKKEIFSH